MQVQYRFIHMCFVDYKAQLETRKYFSIITYYIR